MSRTPSECHEIACNAWCVLLIRGEEVHYLKAEANITGTVQLWSAVRWAGLGRECQILVEEIGYAEIQCDQTIRGRGRIDFLQKYCSV